MAQSSSRFKNSWLCLAISFLDILIYEHFQVSLACRTVTMYVYDTKEWNNRKYVGPELGTASRFWKGTPNLGNPHPDPRGRERVFGKEDLLFSDLYGCFAQLQPTSLK